MKDHVGGAVAIANHHERENHRHGKAWPEEEEDGDMVECDVMSDEEELQLEGQENGCRCQTATVASSNTSR